ncbi:MAG: phosphopantothenoylcysteine decarboxylase [Chthoniobacterales bacterium]
MRILITAGPTREPLDPVRFLSNRSSGKMGYALTEAALEFGHDVTLISGPVALTPPLKARTLRITTSDELYDVVHAQVHDCDLLVMCAAVSDYKPISTAAQKMAKQTGEFALRLTPTRDILASLPRANRSYFVVGFAAETHNLAASAQKKLIAKNCDAIVANDVSGKEIGMESNDNAVTIFFRDGETKSISRAPKKNLACEILKIIFDAREKSLTKKP